MAELSPASFWSGPPTDADAATWSQDPAVADLVGRLAQRRLPIDQAQAAIATFAAESGDHRRERLLALFAGLFDTLNGERGAVLAGLDRYGRRQQQLADSVRAEVESLHAQQDAATPDQQQIAALTEKLGWDTRVFEARRQSVSTACDIPTVIEQRLFALGRAIQGQLGDAGTTGH